jgi:hypothetical protein
MDRHLVIAILKYILYIVLRNVKITFLIFHETYIQLLYDRVVHTHTSLNNGL